MQPSRIHRASGMLVLLPLLAFGLAGCDEGPVQPQAAQAEPPSVDVVHAERQAVSQQFEFVGRVQAIERVELRARIEGFLEERSFREGDLVRAGSPMFRIERDTFEARVELARAHLAAAEALKVEADANLARAQQLVERGNISQQSVDEAEANARTTAADVLARTAELRQAEIDLSYTEISTPISGPRQPRGLQRRQSGVAEQRRAGDGDQPRSRSPSSSRSARPN